MGTVISGLVAGDKPCISADIPLEERAYLLAVLPGVQLGLALLTIGLIRPWGEVFPRWLPVVGGRRVPVAFAVGAATTGAVLLLAMISRSLLMDLLGIEQQPLEPLPPGCTVPGWEVMRWYAPMLLWPPLLLAVTWHYWHRRRRPEPARPPSG